MRLKRMETVILTIVFALGCLSVTGAQAVGGEEIQRVRLDVSTAEHWALSASARVSGRLDMSISTGVLTVADSSFYLTVGESITYTCSYLPRSASVDFGFIAPDGYFYYLNAENGNINRSIQVNQSGSYTLALRNNSSGTVNVTGFVTY